MTATPKGLSEEPRVKKALKKSKTDVALEGGEEATEPKTKAKPAGGGVRNLAQFRNSKLTLMLANSLSGNSKTSVITTARDVRQSVVGSSSRTHTHTQSL